MEDSTLISKDESTLVFKDDTDITNLQLLSSCCNESNLNKSSNALDSVSLNLFLVFFIIFIVDYFRQWS